MQRKKISSIVFFTILLILVSIVFSPLMGFTTLLQGLTIISIFFILLGLLKKEVGLLGIGMIAIMDPFIRIFLATGDNILFRWNTNNYILLISAAVLLAFQGVKIKDISSKFLFLLIVICVLQLTYSTNLLSGSYYILNLFSYFGFLAIFIYLSSGKSSLITESFVVIAVFGLVIHILYRLAANELPYIDHSSVAQSGLSVLYVICLGLSLDSKKSKVPLLLVVVVSSAMFFLIFITGSRSGTTLAIVALIFILAKLGNYTISNRVFAILAGSLVAFALFNQFSGAADDVQYRFAKLLDTNVNLTEKTSNRSDLLFIGWSIFVDNPFGVGTGSLADKQIIRSYAYDYGQNPYLYLSGVNTVHSALMKTLAENGLQGGILLLLFAVSFSYYYIQTTDNRATMAVGVFCTATLLLSFFVTEFQGKSLTYLAAGTTYILYYQTQTQFKYMASRQKGNENILKSNKYGSIEND